MQLKIQKRLVAQLLKCGKKRIWFDSSRLDDIKEAITKADIASLINEGAIKEKPVKGISRFRARKIALQKRKGRRRGPGSVTGKKTARLSKKLAWTNLIKIQRRFLRELRDKGIIPKSTYQKLYMKAKGGFFRSKRHIKLYIEEHGLAKLTSKAK